MAFRKKKRTKLPSYKNKKTMLNIEDGKKLDEKDNGIQFYKKSDIIQDEYDW